MKKKIVLDSLLNIISSIIPIAVLQLFIMPRMASQIDATEYGLVITIISVFNVVSSTSGNSLNNVRLINNDKECEGYGIILYGMSIFNVILISIFSVIYYDKLLLGQIVLNLIVGTLLYFKDYYVVTFRIYLDYFGVFICNILISLGYILGYIIFHFCGVWQFIYICGFLLGIFYIIVTSDIWKDNLKVTNCTGNLAIQTLTLFVASCLYRIPTYADKMIAFPLIGADNVAVLYTATLIGKIISMAISPISAVILSYLSKSKGIDKRIFSKTLYVSVILGTVCYFICLIISEPILRILYPSYIIAASSIIPITTCTVIITSIICIIDPFIMRFYNLRWQIKINTMYVITYLFLVFICSKEYGIIGFCIGGAISECMKLLLEIGIIYIAKENN